MGGCCEHGSGENKVRKTPELCGVKDTKTEGIAFFLAEVYANLRFVFPSTSSNSIFCLTGFAQGWGRGSGWQVGFVRPEQFVIQTSVISSGTIKLRQPPGSSSGLCLCYHPSISHRNLGCRTKCPSTFRGPSVEAEAWRARSGL